MMEKIDFESPILILHICHLLTTSIHKIQYFPLSMLIFGQNLLNFVYPSLQNSTTHIAIPCAVTEDLFIMNNALAKTTQIRNAHLPLTILPNHASTKSQIISKYFTNMLFTKCLSIA